MGTDWPNSLNPRLRRPGTSLPSVAELLSVSLDRPPPGAPTPAEPASWTAVNHPSPNVSPTNPREPSTGPEPLRYHHRQFQPAQPPFTLPATSEACQSLHDAALATPLHSQRQDSAVSQQRIDAHSSDWSFSSSHPSSNHRRHSPTPSPGPHSVAQLPARGHPVSPSSGSYVSMEPIKSHEHLAALSNSASIEQGAPSIGPSLSPSHQTHSTTTRQPRYNVRFIANYTSENMPPSQKPRHDPSPAVPPSSENSEPEPVAQEQPITPSIEPSIQTATPSNQSTEDQSLAQARRRDPSVERCQGCNEPWKRPLPNTDSYRQSSPAENSNDLGRMSMNLIAQLQAHQKKADAMYDRWKWKHSHCVPQHDYDTSPPSPAVTEPLQEDLDSPGGDGALPDSKHPQTPSNKRKSEMPHDGEKRLRKVAFTGQSAATPPIRTSAST